MNPIQMALLFCCVSGLIMVLAIISAATSATHAHRKAVADELKNLRRMRDVAVAEGRTTDAQYYRFCASVKRNVSG